MSSLFQEYNEQFKSIHEFISVYQRSLSEAFKLLGPIVEDMGELRPDIMGFAESGTVADHVRHRLDELTTMFEKQLAEFEKLGGWIPMILETFYCRCYELFESYLTDLVRDYLAKHPEKLMCKERTISWKDLLSLDKSLSLTDHLRDLMVRGISHGGLKELRRFLDKSIFTSGGGIRDEDWALIQKCSDVRNFLVHRAGWDPRERKPIEPLRLPNGQQCYITAERFNDTLKLWSLAYHIDVSYDEGLSRETMNDSNQGTISDPDNESEN